MSNADWLINQFRNINPGLSLIVVQSPIEIDRVETEQHEKTYWPKFLDRLEIQTAPNGYLGGFLNACELGLNLNPMWTMPAWLFDHSKNPWAMWIHSRNHDGTVEGWLRVQNELNDVRELLELSRAAGCDAESNPIAYRGSIDFRECWHGLLAAYRHSEPSWVETSKTSNLPNFLPVQVATLPLWAVVSSALNASRQNEMATDNQADADHTDDGDGLFQDDRIVVWGGVKFSLTTNQAIVFRLLVDAYPGDVLHDTFEDRGIRVLRDSFRFKNAQGKNQNYPCRDLIVGGSVKDSKRLIDPSIVRSNPKKFSNPQHNPQDSPR